VSTVQEDHTLSSTPVTTTLSRILRLLLCALLLAALVPAAQAAPSRAPSVPPGAVSISGPTEGGAGTPYTFTATVTPPDTTLPLTPWCPTPILAGTA
jgi:hypothetical protein